MEVDTQTQRGWTHKLREGGHTSQEVDTQTQRVITHTSTSKNTRMQRPEARAGLEGSETSPAKGSGIIAATQGQGPVLQEGEEPVLERGSETSATEARDQNAEIRSQSWPRGARDQSCKGSGIIAAIQGQGPVLQEGEEPELQAGQRPELLRNTSQH